MWKPILNHQGSIYEACMFTPPRCLNNRHKKKGISLVEAAIVLGVVGLVIGGIWGAASTAYENYKINQTINATQQMVDRARNLFKNQDPASIISSFHLLTTAQLFDLLAKDLDGFSLDASGLRIKDPWGKVVILDVYFLDIGYGLPTDKLVLSIGYGRRPSGGILNVWPVSRCIQMTSKLTAAAKNELANVLLTDGGTFITTFPYMPTSSECVTNSMQYLTFEFYVQ